MKTKSTVCFGLIVCFFCGGVGRASLTGYMVYSVPSPGYSHVCLTDLETGIQTFLPSSVGLGVPVNSDIAISPLDSAICGVWTRWAGFTTIRSLIRIDPITGSGTHVGNIGIFDSIYAKGDQSRFSIAFGPDGTLYGISQDDSRLLAIDTQTGKGTVVGLGPSHVASLVVSGDTALMWTHPYGHKLYEVDLSDASTTYLGDILNASSFVSYTLDYLPDGSLLVWKLYGTLYTLDVDSLAITKIRDLNLTYPSAALAIIPEPGTFALLAAGGLAFLRRKQR